MQALKRPWEEYSFRQTAKTAFRKGNAVFLGFYDIWC